jgi:urease accessory protein
MVAGYQNNIVLSVPHPAGIDTVHPVKPLARGGWLARLHLEYARTERGTHLRRKTHSGPLTIQKALYPEGPEVCHTLILHPPGGIVGNDTLAVEVKLDAGSHALITMPGATKWYRTQDAAATQRLDVSVDSGAALEWLPPETIVFDRAAARMQTSINLAAGGNYIGWEILCLGRTAAGETFDAGDICQTTEVSIAGDLIWSERCRLVGGSPLLASAAGLGGAPVSAVMLAAGSSVAPDLMAQCRQIKIDGGARCGITAMPHIFVARYLGHSSEQAKYYFIELWRVLRPLFTGREAVTPRIWTT